MRVRTIHAAVVAGLVAGSAWMLGGPGAAEHDTKGATPVHTDARAMERAVVETIQALIRDDAAAVGTAVKKIQAGCRELHAEDDDALGKGFRQLDQALHMVLRGTRGYAADGDLEEAFTEFVWVLRTCRQCHTHAREHGHLPAEGVLWDRANSPTKHVETTHSDEGRP